MSRHLGLLAGLVCGLIGLQTAAGALDPVPIIPDPEAANIPVTWFESTPANSPLARNAAEMAYDSARRKTVLFGGIDANLVLRGDTWEWNGVTWSQATPAVSPPARWNSSMVYDSSRQRIVMFGGYNGAALGDTWEWDGSTWTRATPVTSPPARFSHSMAYDSARKKVVLFGGYSFAAGDPGDLGDTWEWDGIDWVQARPASSPSARDSAAMAYDIVRQKVLLFGGHSTTYLNDTWEWNGSTWIQASPATSPSARHTAKAVYDSTRQKIVMFGGWDEARELGDTWEWNGSTWVQAAPKTSPPARNGHAMAYDMARQHVVVFGGARLNARVGDTWVLATGPVASVGDVLVVESNTNTNTVAVTVSLSAAATIPVSVKWSTATGGTATAGTDYVTKAPTVVSFPAGVTSKTIELTIKGDLLVEPDETVTLALSAPTGGLVVGDGTGVVTITDDDSKPTISISDVSIVEGHTGTRNATFKVTLSRAFGKQVTVKWRTTNGTATAPSDFTAKGPTLLSFPPGTSTATVNVPVVGDRRVEPAERFFVDLAEPANATITDGRGIGTISNDD